MTSKRCNDDVSTFEILDRTTGRFPVGASLLGIVEPDEIRLQILAEPILHLSCQIKRD
jgi:hypothetical protein